MFLRAHVAPDLQDRLHGAGRGAVAQDRDAGGDIVVPDAVDAAGEFAEPLLDRAAQLGVVSDLDRVVTGEPGELIGGRQDVGGGVLVFGQELRRRCQEIGAYGALGAADFQQ